MCLDNAPPLRAFRRTEAIEYRDRIPRRFLRATLALAQGPEERRLRAAKPLRQETRPVHGQDGHTRSTELEDTLECPDAALRIDRTDSLGRPPVSIAGSEASRHPDATPGSPVDAQRGQALRASELREP